MTKAQLIDEIMRRARYITLSATEQERVRRSYRAMRKDELQKLIDNAPATWDT